MSRNKPEISDNDIADEIEERRAMTQIEVPCVEICDGDKLVGYAVFFSGGWDAYLCDGLNLSVLTKVCLNCGGKEQAIESVLRLHGKRMATVGGKWL